MPNFLCLEVCPAAQQEERESHNPRAMSISRLESGRDPLDGVIFFIVDQNSYRLLS